jgi:hypothetical protein
MTQSYRYREELCAMLKYRIVGPLLLSFLLFANAAPSRATGCEDTVVRHLVGEAMLAAQFVAAAERNGMTSTGINGILKEVADNSAIQEFWITDPAGHAYLTNTGIDFTFSSDATKQPQASAFWPLLTGAKKVVIQSARKREIDSKVFKYVGVAGVDKPRIVQVGVSAASLCK